MGNNFKIVIGLICLGLAACDDDLVNDLDSEQYVNVYQDDQALSCSTAGRISVEAHSKLLIDENIEIHCSQKGYDGFAYTLSCGSETGTINIFTINDKDLSEAESLGFSSLSNLPDALFIDSCDFDSNNIYMEDFEQQVINVAGTQATDCGKVEINGSSLAVNTCVSDSFVINTPFYSFYVVQGIDSSVAYGVSMNVDGIVEYWHYDSFNGGKISSSVCENASATFDLTGSHTDVFNCTE